MKSPRVLVLCVYMLLPIMSVFAGSDQLVVLVRSFQNVRAPQYHPDSAAQAANAFIAAGEKASYEVLHRLAMPPRDLTGPEKRREFEEFEDLNRRICFVCRLLYVSKPGKQPLAAPRMGVLVHLPYESMDALYWPDLPFAIINGIPLSINLGYARFGMSERADYYVNYCRSNGTFRTQPFTVPSFLSASNALQQVFDSEAWKRLRWKDSGIGWHYDLDEEYAKELLRKQVDNVPRYR